VARSDIYISADIESDGPIPGRYSMLSFGLAVAATFDGQKFAPRDPAAATFARELRPIATGFVPSALAVSGLDRDRLAREGTDPEAATAEAAAWVRAEILRAALVATTTLGGDAAVDDEHRAVGVGRRVRGQERDGAGDVVDGTDPARRHPLLELP
jgi:hypothetical protein